MEPTNDILAHGATITSVPGVADIAGSRRTLLRRGVTLGLVVPLAAPVLRTAAQDTHSHVEQSTPVAAEDHNSQFSQHTEAPVPAEPVRPFVRYDPVLLPATPGTKDITITAADATLLIADGVPFAGWNYDGTIPGKTLRVVEGDTVNVTFRIDSATNAHHSLDLHAAKTAPDVSFRTINPGEEIVWRFVASHPGAYMYHFGTPQILMHIGSGLHGAIIVDSKGGWPPAQELILLQSYLYVKDGPGGVKVPDLDRMVSGKDMDYMVFNGYADQYVEHPIPARVGEPIRIFVVHAGPNVWSSFHVVGTVFDRAYINGSPKNVLFDLQSISIGPGDGACVEFAIAEPGTYPVVNHDFGHVAHGAVALLQAE